MCLKSYFKAIVLELATNGQSDKGFLLTSTLVPKGLSAPSPGAIFMYKSIQIYTRTRCQVSVYRTTDPLVCILLAGSDTVVAFSGSLTEWATVEQIRLVQYSSREASRVRAFCENN